MSAAKTLTAPVAPGGTIGILGGGQLGRMLALAAARLGLKTHILSYEPDAPAMQVTSNLTYMARETRDGLQEFAASCDVITYEFENISPLTVEILGDFGCVRPGLKALAVTQDRYEEKNFVRKLGLATAPFWPINHDEDFDAALLAAGQNAIFKTRRLGYDGKGQAKVGSTDELAKAFHANGQAPSILEAFVDFEFEASVIAARGMNGEFAAYDPPENLHEHHILRRSTVPSRLSPAQCEEAKAIAHRIADALDYVGVFAVELFVTKDGALLVNEIAPRVHNSGHWTIEACLTSQFEQHIRAVAGWPLGDVARHCDAAMENILGAEAADWRGLLARGGCLHLYGKSEIRAGRKMGHITFLSAKK